MRNKVLFVGISILLIFILFGCSTQTTVYVPNTLTTTNVTTKTFYQDSDYELITLKAEGTEAQFKILPLQHYSIAFFVEKELKSDTRVYCTYIPSEGITIHVGYYKPDDRANPNTSGTGEGDNVTEFRILTYSIGWYSLDFYYDPSGKEISTLPEVNIFARWSYDEN